MQTIKLSLTLDEVKAILYTSRNQLFHVKYLDPKFPGYQARVGELEAAESAIRVLELALKEDRLRTPTAWEKPTHRGAVRLVK
jgi:hypothetical protein